MSGPSRTSFIVIASHLLLSGQLGCHNPTDFETKESFQTPEDVVERLIVAYRDRDLAHYMAVYDEQIAFYDGEIEVWEHEVEQRVHEKMFDLATGIELSMQQLAGSIVNEGHLQQTYRYHLKLVQGNKPTIRGDGEVLLEFVSTSANKWKIKAFQERRIGLKKEALVNHSVDYFPLRVGNSWTYEEQLAPGIEDTEVLIEDSVMINGDLYYQAAGHGYFFIVSGSFARQDSLRQLRLFVEDDSTELIIFDLAADIGDSLTFVPPNASEEMVVELISRKDSLTVPAGTFANVLEFLITDNNSGSRYLYEFAAGIGLIRQRGTNQVMSLKRAIINGQKYPVITSVGTDYPSWTQIKGGFR